MVAAYRRQEWMLGGSPGSREAVMVDQVKILATEKRGCFQDT